MYTRKSIPKGKGVAGYGGPSPKNPNVTIVYVDDVLTEPERDANGVRQLGNYVLKADAKMYTLYATPSSLKAGYTIEGDEDAKSIKKTFEGSSPGTRLEMDEFVQNNIEQGFIIIYGAGCGDSEGRTMGTICNPMKFTGEFTDDKDGAKTILKFEQTINDGLVPGYYEGELIYAENTTSGPDIDMLKADGVVYQLPETDTTDDITANSIDLDHNTIISVIGGGGAAPFTLSEGVQGAVTVLLKNSTQWTGLKNAVINLKVFKASGTTYLVEQSRG